MVSSKIFGLFFILILLATSISGLDSVSSVSENLNSIIFIEDTEDNETLTYEISGTYEIDEFDIDIKTKKNKVKIKNSKDSTYISEISFKNGKTKMKGSDIITIKNAKMKNATIILRKYYDVDLELLYSSDYITFVKANETYEQNSTHLWFSTTHFSSWTTSMPPIYLFTDVYDSSGDRRIEIHLEDYSSITGTDISNMCWRDEYASSSICRSIILDYPHTIKTDDISYYGDDLYTIYKASHYQYAIELDSSIGENDMTVEDNYGGDRFSIYDSTGDTLIDDSGSVSFYIDEFYNPVVHTNGVTVGTSSGSYAYLKLIPDFNDLRHLDFYDAYPLTKNIYFKWKLSTDGSYTTTSTSSASHNTVQGKSIGPLTDCSTYDYYALFYYYDPTDGNGGAYTTINSAVAHFDSFCDTPVPSVSVSTPTSVTDTTATLNAISDFDGYSSTIYGMICISDGVYGYECTTPETITDATTFDVATSTMGATVHPMDAGSQYNVLAYICSDSSCASVLDTSDVYSFYTTGGASGEGFIVDNVVAFFPMSSSCTENTEGTDGTAGNGPNWVSTTEGCNFVATNSEYVDVTSSFNQNLYDSAFYFSVWANVDSISSETNLAILGASIGGSSVYTTTMFQASDDSWVLQSVNNAGGTSASKTSASSVTANVWTHFAGNINGDGEITEFYVNNVDKGGSSTNSAGLDDIVKSAIGALPWAGSNYVNYLNGQVLGVLYGTGSLSVSDVENIYDEGRSSDLQETGTEAPTINTDLVDNINYSSATLNGFVSSAGDYSSFLGKYRYKLNTTATWTESSCSYNITNTTLSPYSAYSCNISSLNDNEVYDTQFYLQLYAGESTSFLYSQIRNFTTLERQLPVFDISSVTPLSTSAQYTGWIYTKGDYDSFYTYYRTFNGSVWSEDFCRLNTSTLGSFSTCYDYTLTQLSNYNVTLFLEIGNQSYTNNTLNFTTIASFPTVQIFNIFDIEDVVATIDGRIDDYNVYTNITVYYNLLNNKTNVTTENLCTATKINTVDDLITEYVFDYCDLTSLTESTNYTLYQYISYDGSAYLNSDIGYFATIGEEDVFRTSGTFELLPNWNVEINDVYLFSIIVLVGIAIIGLSFGFVVERATGQLYDNTNKFLIYIVLCLQVVAIIFLYLNSIIPTWQLLVSMVGLAIISIFYMLNGGVNSYG